MDSLCRKMQALSVFTLRVIFFNSDYMWAWWLTASENPNVLFYAYTKSLRYWIDVVEQMPILDNLILTASYGGRDDWYD